MNHEETVVQNLALLRMLKRLRETRELLTTISKNTEAVNEGLRKNVDNQKQINAHLKQAYALWKGDGKRAVPPARRFTLIPGGKQ